MGRKAGRNVRVMQAALAHHLRRGWLLSTLYLSHAVPEAVLLQPPGAWGVGVSHAPSQPSWDGARSGLH